MTRPHLLPFVALVVTLTVVPVGTACRHGGGSGSSATAGSRTPSPSRTTTAPAPTATGTPVTSRPQTAPPPTPPPSATTSTPALPAALRGVDWTRIPTGHRVVALTFDAGGDAAGVPSVLATLARERVPATFFLTGAFVTGNPDSARRVCTAHRVGDHSATHAHFTQLPAAAIRTEVLGAADTIRRICGADPRPLFRFPYGDRDARTIAAVNALGYVPVSWTVDTLGWEGTGAGVTAGVVVARVVSRLQPGEIVLMHVGANPQDHSTLDADALPEVIRQVRAHGYGFVTLDALLG